MTLGRFLALSGPHVCIYTMRELDGIGSSEPNGKVLKQTNKQKIKLIHFACILTNTYILPFPIETCLLLSFAETHYPLCLAFIFQLRMERGWGIGHTPLCSKKSTAQLWCHIADDISLWDAIGSSGDCGNWWAGHPSRLREDVLRSPGLVELGSPHLR